MARPKPGHEPIVTVEDSPASVAVRTQQADRREAYRKLPVGSPASAELEPSAAVVGSTPAVLPEQVQQTDTDPLHP